MASDPTHAAPTSAWRAKVITGAILMCIAAVGAQFSTKDFLGNVWAMRVVAITPPLSGLLAIFLLTSPPGGGGRGILATIGPLAAAVVVAGFLVGVDPRRERLEAVVRTITFVCTPLAGVATYLHLARVVARRRHRVVAVMFGLLAALLVAGAILY